MQLCELLTYLGRNQTEVNNSKGYGPAIGKLDNLKEVGQYFDSTKVFCTAEDKSLYYFYTNLRVLL